MRVSSDDSQIEHFFSLKNDISWINGTAQILDLSVVGEPNQTYSLQLGGGVDLSKPDAITAKALYGANEATIAI